MFVNLLFDEDDVVVEVVAVDVDSGVEV